MNLKLKPIKPDIPIQSHNYTILISILIILVIILILIFFLKKYTKIKKEKQALFALTKEPKKFAYQFPKKAQKYKTQKNEKILEEILKELKNYKYKPKVEKIDDKTLNLIKKFLGIK